MKNKIMGAPWVGDMAVATLLKTNDMCWRCAKECKKSLAEALPTCSNFQLASDWGFKWKKRRSEDGLMGMRGFIDRAYHGLFCPVCFAKVATQGRKQDPTRCPLCGYSPDGAKRLLTYGEGSKSFSNPVSTFGVKDRFKGATVVASGPPSGTKTGLQSGPSVERLRPRPLLRMRFGMESLDSIELEALEQRGLKIKRFRSKNVSPQVELTPENTAVLKEAGYSFRGPNI